MTDTSVRFSDPLGARDATRSGPMRLLAAAVLVLPLGACDADAPTTPPDEDPDPTFRVDPVGLEDASVFELEVEGKMLYAGTDRGVYARELGTGSEGWDLLGLEEEKINALLPDGEAGLLAAVELDPEDEPSDTISLHRRPTGADATWEPFQNGFGVGVASGFEVGSLTRLSDETLLAGGGAAGVVARSTDDGGSWEVVWGAWDQPALGTHAIVEAPSDPQVVYAGGELGLFAPFLEKSTDGGESWSRLRIEAGGDNAVNDILVDPGDADAVLAGLEGEMQRTVDGGATWETVLAPESELYFFGLATDVDDPERVYAGGWIRGAPDQDLVLSWTDDGGATWSESRHHVEGSGAILSMISHQEAGLLLGTESGVFRVTVE